MLERLVRFGCLLNSHAMIRPAYYTDTIDCRCGKRRIAMALFFARYR